MKREKSAESQFKKLGYERIYLRTPVIRYGRPSEKCHKVYCCIDFCKASKTVSGYEENEHEIFWRYKEFTLEELKAINKQIQELGW